MVDKYKKMVVLSALLKDAIDYGNMPLVKQWLAELTVLADAKGGTF
ncbi:MAG TPA: hypothetical protein VIK78_19805 [Ruminiclostridium sp.]